MRKKLGLKVVVLACATAVVAATANAITFARRSSARLVSRSVPPRAR